MKAVAAKVINKDIDIFESEDGREKMADNELQSEEKCGNIQIAELD